LFAVSRTAGRWLFHGSSVLIDNFRWCSDMPGAGVVRLSEHAQTRLTLEITGLMTFARLEETICTHHEHDMQLSLAASTSRLVKESRSSLMLACPSFQIPLPSFNEDQRQFQECSKLNPVLDHWAFHVHRIIGILGLQNATLINHRKL
jgi:hypothetical protein